MKSNKQGLISFPFDDSSDSYLTYKKDTLSFCNEYLSGQQEFIVFTSGSTGKPKPLSISRLQMIASAQMTASFFGLKRGDKALVCLNTNYIAGKMMLVRGIETGMQMSVCFPVSNPLKKFNENTQFDFVALVPFQFQTILEESPEKVKILDNMKAILLGGAPITKSVEKLVHKVKAAVYSTYGMTETVSHIAIRRLNGIEASTEYTVLPEIEISQDERNCLKIKGKVTKNEWVTTNDIVKLISKDKFMWIGRADNIINSGGIKIQVEQLEKEIGEVFLSLNLQNRFIITSIPDPDLGSVAVLLIEGKTGRKRQAQIMEILAEKVSKYELPKKVFELDHFRETATGKVDRISSKALIL